MIKITTPVLGEEELKEVKKVLDSGYLVQNKYVKLIEEFISKYVGTKHAVAVSSGTAALHLSLLSLGIKEGDEVIVPDFTFPATVNVVEMVGAKPILVDIDPETFCINTEEIESKITNKTKAIMPVHEFGNSANMDEIIKVSKKYNLKIIEDAACALGTEYKKKKIGSIGDIGCFSFHPRKSVTTGEGGIITTNDPEIYEKLQILRNHGISKVEGKVDFVLPGYNYRLTDIQAAIGVVQLKKLEEIIDKKINLAEIYNRELKNIDKIRAPKYQEEVRHTYQTYHVILSESINRDEVIKELKKNEIESNYGAYAIHALKYYREKYKLDDSEFKNSLKAYNQGLALPLSYELDEKDVIFVVKKLKEIIQKG
ncbi:DegT/DnrJ/EryC1/StrS family aminotransferase [Geotoga petraea]|uniref:dTDP-4-amino-4,6-dideoxygalactose transaminase n=1 Tax=Geotoga petraea TaxID=28234 RepID=A0A1G6Q9P0_9BACT|nr:DegT/DnrJ/EryC1/StrS family aminotransferase [Geotoga petraea]SDC89232.1 dTDP-4-amino-4,6-dideoxygalactose transaminase [Geotoga petraea]